MATRLTLRPALFETASAIAAAVLLWGPERISLPPAALQSELMLWAVAAAAGLAFFVDFTLWAQGGSRLRLLLRLPVEFKRWLLLPLLITRRLLRDCACLLVILGVLSVAAANRSDPRLFDDLVLGVGGALALLVIVRAASVPFFVASEILRFPLFRLVALAGAYYLINQPWPTTYGFPDSPLFAALGLAMGLSYFGSALRNVTRTSHRWAEEGRVWPRVVAGHLVLTATLSGAVSLALIVWGCVATLPNVSAALLGEWPFDLVGIRTQPLFGLLYGARYLIAGFWMLLVFSARLPATMGPLNTVNYMPLLKATGLGLAGCVSWLLGAELAPLGHGYVLLGAIVGTGLLVLAISRLARYFTDSPDPLLGDVSRWLAKSSLRAILLGTFLATYGLLLRPLFYHVLWFAPIFEWLVVLTFALVAIMWSRSHIRRGVGAGPAPRADWTQWSRHVQTTEEKRDPHLDGLLAFQWHFIDTGEWRRMWTYLLGLMLRNQVSMQHIPPVFEPLRSCYLASTRTDPWPRRAGRLRKRRGRALSDAIGLAEAALSSPKFETEELDELRLWAIAEPFVELGADPTELAVALSNAYCQRGADLNLAIDLWFPLMTLTDRPRARLLRRLATLIFRLLRRERKDRTWGRERRMAIVHGAASHLFGEETIDILTVAILDEEVRTDDYFSLPYLWRLLPGEPVEVWENARGLPWWRPGDGLRFYAASTDIKRRPVLPKDYAVAERRLITA